MDKLDLEEKILGGIFGIVSILAAIAEMIANGISIAGILGTVKDVFGTLIVVVLLIAVVKILKPSQKKSFRDVFNNSMEKVENNYRPLIKKVVEKDTDSEAKSNKLKKVIRYAIACKTEVLFGYECNDYIRLFDIDAENPTEINFYIREKFFGSTESVPFDYDKIASDIMMSLSKRVPGINISKNIKDASVTVKFSEPLMTSEDAEMLSQIIDIVILLYVAENKKVLDNGSKK